MSGRGFRPPEDGRSYVSLTRVGVDFGKLPGKRDTDRAHANVNSIGRECMQEIAVREKQLFKSLVVGQHRDDDGTVAAVFRGIDHDRTSISQFRRSSLCAVINRESMPGSQ